MSIALAMISLTVVTTLLNQVTEATTTQTNSAGFDYNDFDQGILRMFFDDEYEEDQHHVGRVYYSHSMMMYGTNDKQIEKEIVRNIFSEFGIVSPKFYEGNPQRMLDEMDKLYQDNKGKPIEEMEFYKMIVSGCQMLVYSTWKGQIPSGVAIEVNHAIDLGIPVFELVGDRVIPQKVHVQGMTYEETTKMYEEY